MKSPFPGNISLSTKVGKRETLEWQEGHKGWILRNSGAKEGAALHKLIRLYCFWKLGGKKGIVHSKYEPTHMIQTLYMNCLMRMY